MSDQRSISVFDELRLNELPQRLRAHLMALVADAYVAGYEEAKTLAESDARLGMSWLSVPIMRETGASLWLCGHAVRFLGADVPIPSLAECSDSVGSSRPGAGEAR